MSKRYARGITVLFCLFLGGLLLWHLALPDRERSDVENRTLAQRPEFSWDGLVDGSYTKAVESYFADQFPLRDGWTGLKARTEQLIGKREFHDVYLCGDKLISKVPQPDETLVEKNLSYIKHLAEHTEIPVHLGLIPSAAEIWKDQLPKGAESWDQTLLMEQAEKLGLDQIDLYTPLQEQAKEPIFYRTDHHWTSLGAYYGAQTLLESLGEAPLNRAEFQPEAASKSFCGTLYSSSGIHWLPPDTIEFWVEDQDLNITSWRDGTPKEAQLYERSYLEKKDQYSAFLGGNQPLCVIQNETLPEGKKILLVRDSYSDSLAPFLAQRFSEVHLIDLRYYHASVAQYAKENGIDEICILYSIPNFITERNIAFLTQ